MGLPFSDALSTAFTFSFVACLVAAWASWLRGGKYHHREAPKPAADGAAGPDGRAPAARPGVGSGAVAER